MDKNYNTRRWYVQKNLRAISLFFRETCCSLKTAFQTSKLGLEEKCTFKIHELLEY